MPKLSSINLSAKTPLYEAMEESTKGVRLARNRTAAQIKAVCDWLEEGMPMETRSRLRKMLMREVEIAHDSLDISIFAPKTPGFVTEGHPITPPDEMCARLLGSGKTFYEMLIEAARWGADTELEACCEWMVGKGVLESYTKQLRDLRRPKPPTLKEQALEEMRALVSYMEGKGEIAVNFDTIRQVIDSLPDTES